MRHIFRQIILTMSANDIRELENLDRIPEEAGGCTGATKKDGGK